MPTLARLPPGRPSSGAATATLAAALAWAWCTRRPASARRQPSQTTLPRGRLSAAAVIVTPTAVPASAWFKRRPASARGTTHLAPVPRSQALLIYSWLRCHHTGLPPPPPQPPHPSSMQPPPPQPLSLRLSVSHDDMRGRCSSWKVMACCPNSTASGVYAPDKKTCCKGHRRPRLVWEPLDAVDSTGGSGTEEIAVTTPSRPFY